MTTGNGLQIRQVEVRDGGILDAKTGEVYLTAEDNPSWRERQEDIMRALTANRGETHLVIREGEPAAPIPSGTRIGKHIVAQGPVVYIHAGQRPVGHWFDISEEKRGLTLVNIWDRWH